MKAEISIASNAQRGTVIIVLTGPFLDSDGDSFCSRSIHLGLHVRDRLNDKIESAAEAFIDLDAAEMLCAAMTEIVRQARLLGSEAK